MPRAFAADLGDTSVRERCSDSWLRSLELGDPVPALLLIKYISSIAHGHSRNAPSGHGANVDRTDGPGRRRTRLISAAEFQQLADVPAAAEWLANVDNPNTRRAYGSDVGEFMSMLGVRRFGELRLVRRAHVIAWRKMLEERGLGPATRCRKLSAVSSLFRYLCNANAVHENPVSGVRRPRMENANEGRTPALSDGPGTAAPQRSGGGEPPGPAPTGRSWLCCSTTGSGATRSPASRSASLHEHRTGACRTSGSAARAPRPGPSRSTRPRSRPWAITSSSPRTAATGTHPCSGRPRPAGSAGRSRATASTSSSASTPRPPPSPWSASSTHCGPRPPPTPSSTRPTSPASRTGSATPTSAPPALRPADTPDRGQPHVPGQLLTPGSLPCTPLPCQNRDVDGLEICLRDLLQAARPCACLSHGLSRHPWPVPLR